MRVKFSYYLIAIAFLVFGMAFWLANLYTDWLWFSSLKYESVFTTILFSELGLRLASGLIFFIFLLVNLLLTRKFLLQKIENFRVNRKLPFDENVVVIQQNAEQWLEKINKRTVGVLFLLASVVLAFMTSGAYSGDWITLQKFLNSVEFGTTDPLFNKDIGFYVFNLPFYNFLLSFVTWTTVVTALAVAAVYFVAEAMENNGRFELLKSNRSRFHISALAAVYFVFKAIDYYLTQYSVLFSGGGVVYGAGFTDINVRLLALKVLAVLALLAAVVILINIFLRRFNLVLYSIVGIIVVSIILNGVVPYAVEKFIVEPNQYSREEPFIEDNIEFTRKAYGLDKIETAKFPAGELLEAQDIQESRETIDNIRLWDWKPLQQTYAQLQEMRLYYDFSDIDIDRYTIDGEYRQVMLAPRELNQDQLPTQAQTWVNQTLTYTHGYGVAMSPVNEVSSEGLPKFFIKDIPPKGPESIPLEHPEIYFGEKTNNYVIVNTDTKEFDYPKGDKNVYTTYKEDSGIELGSIVRRLLFAYVLSDTKLLFTGDINPDSQVLMYRNIRERVPKLAPFLSFDNDPYIVASEGKLYWMWDAYTTTNMYPYSEPFQGETNYLRNSVKVIVDAYTGDVNFYIANQEDPLIKSYSSIFPDMFKQLEEMPEDLKNHIRYPIDLFNVQAQMYTNYHMLNPQVFYNKEDRWEMPTEVFEGNEQSMEPYYTIIKMPDSDKAEFVQILPFTPTNKKNMIAWMAGRSDGENYGRLLLYEFPKQELVYGAMQIEARIDQDTTISQQLSLWDQRGSSVIRGNLLVIPVKDSIIYVEPLYLKSEQSSMPELRRVIVAHGDEIVMEPTLEQCLQRIFGEDTGVPTPPADGEPEDEPEIPDNVTIDSLVKRASQIYDEAQEQLKNGDWAAYGESQQQLKEILEQLSQQNI